MAAPLNVLFITADQWRGDCISALGNGTAVTPNLDQLARNGLLFTRHFCQATPCGPSRASIYTGMYLHNHRMIDNGTPLDHRHTNIALEMRKLGYAPAVIGHTDIAPDPRGLALRDPDLQTYEGLLPGFHRYGFVTESTVDDFVVWLADHGYRFPNDAGAVFAPEQSYPGTERYGPCYAPTHYPANVSETAYQADLAIRFIRERHGRPWFLHLSFMRPHPPYIAPAPYNAIVDPDTGPAFRRAGSPLEESAQHPYLRELIAHQTCDEGVAVANDPTSVRHQRQLRAAYYGLMQEVDSHIGRIVEFLDSAGALEQTLLIFTSDHGDQMWDHWLLGKRAYFDQSLHVPLIFHAPSVIPADVRGRQLDCLTESIDLLPTILDLAGGAIPIQCDGTNLRTLLETGIAPAGWRDMIFSEQDFRHQDVAVALGLPFDHCVMSIARDSRYKYVHFAELPPLLFDLERDPDERFDLANSPAAAPILARMAQRMLSWRQRTAERILTGLTVGRAGLCDARAVRTRQRSAQ